jgi:3-deoxy-D-manno-octulosonic acid (KDO) 8-phosphate synthase
MTMKREIAIGSIHIGGNAPLVLIAGSCVIESESHAMKMAETSSTFEVALVAA